MSVQGGAGFVTRSVMVDVGTLLIAVVSVFIAAPFMDAVGSGATVTAAGNLSSTDQFNVISLLAFGILPLGYAVGILAVSIRSNWGLVQGAGRLARGRMGGY